MLMQLNITALDALELSGFYNAMTLENATGFFFFFFFYDIVVYDISSVVVTSNRDVRPLSLALNIKPFPQTQLHGDRSII